MAQVTHSSEVALKENEHQGKGFEIFVGGMARSVTEDMIREVFVSCGEIVDVRIMKDKNGSPKGYCFVRFASKEATFKALKEKNGYVLQGKKIGISLSTDQNSLFLGNLRKDWSFEEFDKILRQAFRDIVSVDLAIPSDISDSSTGKRQQNRGFAFVQFVSHAAAARACRLASKPDFLLGNCHPVVDWAEKEPEIDPDELAKIKTAFVGNLPKNTDEEYLSKLFQPFGKVEKVALSRKGRFPVGFVHFAERSELDNAIKEMDGKTVEGPEKGPIFKIQVAVAKPVEKDRKRHRDESQSKPVNLSRSLTKTSKDNVAHDSPYENKLKAPRLNYSLSVPDGTDPYEKAVASLPSSLAERLLRIFRLGIATRYDIDIQLLTSLKELPESAAITVLDQFLLSCADGYDKGRQLAGLIARHKIDNLGSNWTPSNLPGNLGSNGTPSYLPGRTREFAHQEPELPSLSGLSRAAAFDPLVSRPAGTVLARHDMHTPSPSLHRYSSSILEDTSVSRFGAGKLEETGSLSSYRTPLSSTGYGSGIASNSRHVSTVDRVPKRPQVKFDPFTGQPYKFDPFTGEPIQPPTNPRHPGSLV